MNTITKTILTIVGLIAIAGVFYYFNNSNNTTTMSQNLNLIKLEEESKSDFTPEEWDLKGIAAATESLTTALENKDIENYVLVYKLVATKKGVSEEVQIEKEKQLRAMHEDGSLWHGLKWPLSRLKYSEYSAPLDAGESCTFEQIDSGENAVAKCSLKYVLFQENIDELIKNAKENGYIGPIKGNVEISYAKINGVWYVDLTQLDGVNLKEGIQKSLDAGKI